MDKFEPIRQVQMKSDVVDLITTGSEFKGRLFKCVLNAERITDKILSDYLSNVVSLIGTYDNYSDKIKDVFDETDDPGVKTIWVRADDVEDYIYADYDYASILPFTDGVEKGVESGKFEDDDDIEDFFDFTTNKAFKDRASSTAGLLDEVMDLREDHTNDEKKIRDEIARYKSLRKQHMFDRRDSKELYDAIEHVAKFLQKKINTTPMFILDKPALGISVINHVVEYMTYSVVAYVTRIYAIGQYAEQFADTSDSIPVQEAADLHSDTIASVELDYIDSIDPNLFRDMERDVDLDNSMREWLKNIGADHVSNEDDDDKTNGNPFLAKMRANPLVEFLRKHRMYNSDKDKARFAEDLKALTHNEKQPLPGTSTPEQDILHIIASTKPEHETVESYKTLASEMVEAIDPFLSCIHHVRRYVGTTYDAKYSSISVNKSIHETIKILSDLYKEIGNALKVRARDIELQINKINRSSINKTMGEINLRVPGMKSDINQKDNVMMGVPDTTRSSVDMTALYALPTMESLEMYDEYVQVAFNMASDPYYEAVDVSGIINAILSYLKAIPQRIAQFFDNAQFKAAVKWCREHQESLNQVTFNGPMEVLDYPKDIKFNSSNSGNDSSADVNHIQSMITALRNFDPKQITNEDAVNKFVERLYSTDKDGGRLMKLFQSQTKENQQSIYTKYANMVMFKKDPSDDTPVQQITLQNDADIRDKLVNVWMDNVINSTDTRNGLVNLGKSIQNAFNDMKTHITQELNTKPETQGATQSTSTSTSSTGAPAMPTNPPQANANGTTNSQAASTQTANQQAQAQQQANATDNRADLLNSVLTQTQTAIHQLWGSMYQVITSAIKTQYRYIQDAFSKATK